MPPVTGVAAVTVVGVVQPPELFITQEGYLRNRNGERVDALGRVTRARGQPGRGQRWYTDPATGVLWWRDRNTPWTRNAGW